jgi:hypothetical protein
LSEVFLPPLKQSPPNQSTTPGLRVCSHDEAV